MNGAGSSLGGGSGGGIKCMTVRHPTSPDIPHLGVGRYVRDTPEPAELLRIHREKAQATKHRLAVSAAEGAAQAPAEGEGNESLQVGVQYLPPGATYVDSVVIDVDGSKDDAFSLASVTATAGEGAEQSINNPLSEISMELSEQTQSRPVPRRSRSRRQPVMFEAQNQS